MERAAFSPHTAHFFELSSNLFFPGTGSSSTNTGPLTHPGSGVSEEKPLALVVDDVADVTEMISLFLGHAGFKVVTAQCAADALQLAETQPFDIVISDIGMPGMNGYQLAQALREMPEYRQVPMIAVTGYSMYDDRARALQSGFNAHMVKPINPSALLDLISDLRD